MNRYIFVSLAVGLISLFMQLWLPAFAAGSNQQYIRQIVTADNKVSRTITWQSAKFTARPLVEYRQQNSRQVFQEFCSVKSIITPQGEVFIYTAVLTSLKEDSRYIYRVGSKDDWSEWAAFTTADRAKCKALIFGDSQFTDYQVWQTTAANAYHANPDADFFISMGDLVDNGEAWYQWEQWLGGAEPLTEQIPVAPLTGNHEAYSIDWQFTMPATYLSLFALPDNGAVGLTGQSYSYDYGPVHFAVLDTQTIELQELYPDLLERQAQWLKKDLAKTQQPWRVVLMHRPAYGLLNGEAANDIGAVFMPIFEKFNVDLVLQGHLHCYSRSKPLLKGKAVTNGPVYICTGRSGDDIWLENHRQAADAAFDDLPDKPNYLTLTAAQDTLLLECFMQNGKKIDELLLEKKINRQLRK